MASFDAFDQRLILHTSGVSFFDALWHTAVESTVFEERRAIRHINTVRALQVLRLPLFAVRRSGPWVRLPA